MDRKELYNNIDDQIAREVKRIIDIAVNKCGLSQKNIAEVLGVAPPTICAWHQGKKTPSLKHYLALQYLKTVLCILARIRNVK